MSKMDDVYCLKQLLKEWNMATPWLWASVKQEGEDLVLTNLTDRFGGLLEYPELIPPPIKSLLDSKFSIGSVSDNPTVLSGEYVRVKFDLAEKKDRNDLENPFAIQILRDTVHFPIPLNAVRAVNDDTFFIDETAIDSFLAEQQAKIDERLATKREELASFQTTKQREGKEIADKIARQQAKLNKTARQVGVLREELNSLSEKKNEAERHLHILESAGLVDVQNSSLRRQLDHSNAPAASQIARFDGNFRGLISRIHRYLYVEKDLLYPKPLLETFMALLAMGDMVVMAGPSGSGKSHLVRSFGEAVGAAVTIIPVKPNWTSTDDLLGYFNPLTNQYQKTPFLLALLDAKHNPAQLHLICLDEMNLARPEYYLADFLSEMEKRDGSAELRLYEPPDKKLLLDSFLLRCRSIFKSEQSEMPSEDEIRQVWSRFIAGDDNNEAAGSGIGSSDTVSEATFEIRRLVSLMEVPSRMIIPSNVRLLGTVNMDSTTHALSPKLLDRVHILSVSNPLLYDSQLLNSDLFTPPNSGEANDPALVTNDSLRTARAQAMGIPDEPNGANGEYPKYDPNRPISKILSEWAPIFHRLGVDVGMRTLRQAQLYEDMLALIIEKEDQELEAIALNNILLQKILPRFAFELNVAKRSELDTFMKAVALRLKKLSKTDYEPLSQLNAVKELERIESSAMANNNFVDYWM